MHVKSSAALSTWSLNYHLSKLSLPKKEKKRSYIVEKTIFEKNCFLVFFFIAILYFKSQYLSSLFDFSLVSMSQIELFAFFSWSLYHPVFTRLMLNQMKLKR